MKEIRELSLSNSFVISLCEFSKLFLSPRKASDSIEVGNNTTSLALNITLTFDPLIDSTILWYTYWNFQGQKPRPIEIPHYFFWSSLEFPLFFINSWNFCILFFQCPWKCHVLNYLSLNFSGMTHSQLCSFFFYCSGSDKRNISVR